MKEDLVGPHNLAICCEILTIAARANVYFALFGFADDGVYLFIFGIIQRSLFAYESQFHLALRIIA